ncbi:MAG: hypothetical protein AB1646_18595 [Thermodesulfobacteriota bacterium]
MADKKATEDGIDSARSEPSGEETQSAKGSVLSGLAVLPALGLALLPKGACPVCWAAYAGIFGSVGIGFTTYSAYLFPLTVLFLGLSVSALAYRALKQDRYGPLIAGAIASVIIIFSEFLMNWDGGTYGGVVLLLVASIWNSFPQKALTPSQRLQEVQLREALANTKRRKQDADQA